MPGAQVRIHQIIKERLTREHTEQKAGLTYKSVSAEASCIKNEYPNLVSITLLTWR
jgi:hypothetical protein